MPNDSSNSTPLNRTLLITGIVLTAVFGSITELSTQFRYEFSNDDMPTILYLLLHFAGCGLIGIVAIQLYRMRGATFGTSKVAIGLVIGFAILFRLIQIPGVPIHESDFYRYLWDGKVADAGINPYAYEPGALFLWEENVTVPFEDPSTGVTWHGRTFYKEEIPTLTKLAELRDENPVLFERVSHPAVTTIYPPVAQAVFFLSHRLFGESLWGMKLIFVAFDFGVVLVVIALLRRLGRSPAWAVLYAWNPLVLKEFSNSAHYDSIPIFFTVLAIWLVLRAKRHLGLAALAAGMLAKYFSILLLPILASGRSKVSIKSLAISGLIFASFVAIGFLPHLIWGGAGPGRVFAGLDAYNSHWQYNPGVFAIVSNLFYSIGGVESLIPAKIVVALILLAVIVRQTFIETRDDQHLVRKCAIVVGALFILSPTAFPWYFAWVLPFICLFPRPSWIILGFLLPINYLDFHSPDNFPIAHQWFLEIPVLSWICWGTFLVLFLAESAFLRFRKPQADTRIDV